MGPNAGGPGHDPIAEWLGPYAWMAQCQLQADDAWRFVPPDRWRPVQRATKELILSVGIQDAGRGDPILHNDQICESLSVNRPTSMEVRQIMLNLLEKQSR